MAAVAKAKAKAAGGILGTVVHTHTHVCVDVGGPPKGASIRKIPPHGRGEAIEK